MAARGSFCGFFSLPFRLVSLIGPFAVTVRTDHITLGDFGGDFCPRVPSLTSRVCQGKALLLFGPVVEIHDVVGVALATVRTGHILGLMNPSPIALRPFLFQRKIIRFVLLIMGTLVGAV